MNQKDGRRSFALALILALVLLPYSVGGEDEHTGRLLLEIGAEKITVGDFLLYLRQVNPRMDFFNLSPADQRYWFNEFLSKKLFARRAHQEGLDEVLEVRARLEFFTEGVLAQEYRDKLTREIPVSEQELKEYYDAHLNEFRAPARVLLEHFLYKTPEKAARGEQKLRAGVAYDELAREKKDDAEVLLVERDWFIRELLITEVAAVVFELPAGAISRVIRSHYGYHVVRVEAVEPSRLQDFTAVRPDIIRKVQQKKAASVFEQTLEETKRSLAVRTYFERLQP
jgi:peptidyl-prolyl cis-trans isomerase C